MGQAKAKLNGCRPLEQINVEYSMACGQLGDYTYRRGMLAKEIEKITQRLAELDLEACSAKEQEADLALKALNDVRKGSPADDTPVLDKNGTEYVPCTTEDCLAAEQTA